MCWFLCSGQRGVSWYNHNEDYIITAPDFTAANIAGVYAAGDVQEKIYHKAVAALALESN